MLTLTLPPTVRLVAPVRRTVWTDHPVTTETPIKAVHVNELRRVVDARRRTVGLAPFAWTDDPVIAGYSVIRAVHFLELREAIQGVWTAACLGPLPEWTCGSPPSPERVIYASDVNDLRAWMSTATP
jgi:hypothetical protein